MGMTYSGWDVVEPWGTCDYFIPGTGIRAEPTRLQDLCFACMGEDHRHLSDKVCGRPTGPEPMHDFPCLCKEK